MGMIHPANPVKVFVGVLTAFPDLLEHTRESLSARLGRTDGESSTRPFEETRYYEDEMGGPLVRRFYSFERLMDPAQVVDLKHWTNGLEAAMAHDAPPRPNPSGGVPVRRPVNFDPGYVALDKVVLVTTKNYSHRLYLGRGIYGEVTLAYQHGRFEPQPWTYPDYRSPDYAEFFLGARQRLKAQFGFYSPGTARV